MTKSSLKNFVSTYFFFGAFGMIFAEHYIEANRLPLKQDGFETIDTIETLQRPYTSSIVLHRKEGTSKKSRLFEKTSKTLTLHVNLDPMEEAEHDGYTHKTKKV